jgi:agmatinase
MKSRFVGFGGLPVMAIDKLPPSGHGKLCFYGVDVDLGREFGPPNDGSATFVRSSSARLRPDLVHHMRNERLANTYGACTSQYRGYDVGIFVKKECELGQGIAVMAAALSRSGYVPAMVACDHTASCWQTCGVAYGRQVAYIYLDAHLDLGLHHREGRSGLHNGNFVERLRRGDHVSEIINIGARASSTYASVYGGVAGVRILRWKGLGDVLQNLVFLRGREVYVSIDADVVDPVYAPNVGCPEPLGPSSEDILHLLTWFSMECKVVGADFCELRRCDALPFTGEIGALYLFEVLAGRRRHRKRPPEVGKGSRP